MSFATSVLYMLAILSMIWVWYDVWTNQKRMKNLHKWIWSILAIPFSILVAGIYYFVVKKD